MFKYSFTILHCSDEYYHYYIILTSYFEIYEKTTPTHRLKIILSSLFKGHNPSKSMLIWLSDIEKGHLEGQDHTHASLVIVSTMYKNGWNQSSGKKTKL